MSRERCTDCLADLEPDTPCHRCTTLRAIGRHSGNVHSLSAAWEDDPWWVASTLSTHTTQCHHDRCEADATVLQIVNDVTARLLCPEHVPADAVTLLRLDALTTPEQAGAALARLSAYGRAALRPAIETLTGLRLASRGLESPFIVTPRTAALVPPSDEAALPW